MADPDLKLKEGGAGAAVFCRLPFWLFFPPRFFFLSQNTRATAYLVCKIFFYTYLYQENINWLNTIRLPVRCEMVTMVKD